MSLSNVWHLRTVAETSSKPCFICYKPTASVLITPDSKDYFYICREHLKDRGFCSPIVDEVEEAAKKKKADLDREIEIIKKEYEEKMKKKKKAKAKDKTSKEKDEAGDEKDRVKAKEDEDDVKAEKEKDDKIKAVTISQISSVNVDDTPRIYSLHRDVFQMRLNRIRNAEMAKRNLDRLKNPSAFPSVPKGDL